MSYFPPEPSLNAGSTSHDQRPYDAEGTPRQRNRDSFITTASDDSRTTSTSTSSSTITSTGSYTSNGTGSSATTSSGDSSSRTSGSTHRDHRRTSSSISSVVQAEIADLEQMIYKIKEQLELHRRRADAEERRANEAERKLQEYAEHLARVNKARLVAQQEANKANEELRLYKIQLEYAQREINRAQSVLDLVEKQRCTAEKEAADAKAKVRKLSEEIVIENARREGRRQGLQEGLDRGRQLIMQETNAISTIQLPTRASLSLDQRSFMNQDYGSDDEDDTRTISTMASHITLQADGRRRRTSYASISSSSTEPLPVRFPATRTHTRPPSIAHSAVSMARPASRQSVVPEPPRPATRSRAPSVVAEPPRPASRASTMAPEPPRPTSRAASQAPEPPRPASRAASMAPEPPRPASRAASTTPEPPRPASRAQSAVTEARPASRAPSVVQDSRPPSRGPSVTHEPHAHSRAPSVAHEPQSHSRAPSVAHSDIRPTSVHTSYSALPRLDYTIPPDNLIPTIVNGVITIPPAFEFHKMPPAHTPERQPSPMLRSDSYDSGTSFAHSTTQQHHRQPSEPDTASTTLSHIEILRDPYLGHRLATSPALSAVQEVSSQGVPSPYHPGSTQDIRDRSMGGSSVGRGGGASTVAGSPYIGHNSRRGSTSSFVPSIHERPPSVMSKASSRAGGSVQGTPIQIQVQPPSIPGTDGARSITKSEQLSPLPPDTIPLKSPSFKSSPLGSTTVPMPGGIYTGGSQAGNSRPSSPAPSAPPAPSRRSFSGDDDAVSSQISGDGDWFATPSNEAKNISKAPESVVSMAATERTSKTSKTSKSKASKKGR